MLRSDLNLSFAICDKRFECSYIENSVSDNLSKTFQFDPAGAFIQIGIVASPVATKDLSAAALYLMLLLKLFRTVSKMFSVRPRRLIIVFANSNMCVAYLSKYCQSNSPETDPCVTQSPIFALPLIIEELTAVILSFVLLHLNEAIENLFPAKHVHFR